MADGKVYGKIAEVIGRLAKEGIAKSRTNQQQGYKFRGIDDVYNALSQHLADVGLCIIPTVVSREVIERASRTGGAVFSVVVTGDYDLVCAEDGSCHRARMVGEAMDSGDKATNKAMSAAYKYMALQTFCIPVEGEEDADEKDPPPIVPATRPKEPKPEPHGEEPAPPRGPRPASDKQVQAIYAIWKGRGGTKEDLLAHLSKTFSREITSSRDLTSREASIILDNLTHEHKE
jgi:hypothetical protein